MVIQVLLMALWGLLLGLCVGFTSIGTGILGGTGLILLFNMEPTMAVGTVSLAATFMMASGLIKHHREGNINWQVAGLCAVTALPASFFTAHFADSINQILPLKYVIASVIFVSIVLLMYRYTKTNADSAAFVYRAPHKIFTILLGIFLGAVMGATGVTGSVTLIALILFVGLPSAVAVGTTSLVGTGSLAMASVAHLLEGHVNVPMFLSLLPGVAAGAYIGAHFVNRVPERVLQYLVLAILALSAVFILL